MFSILRGVLEAFLAPSEELALLPEEGLDLPVVLVVLEAQVVEVLLVLHRRVAGPEVLPCPHRCSPTDEGHS